MEQPPVCFGKSWSPQAIECKGGLDPLYVNPQDGSHRRAKCSFYERCAPRTCATQMSQHQTNNRLIPPQNLVPQSGPHVAAPVTQPYQARPAQATIQPQAGFAQTTPTNVGAQPAHIAQFGQQMVPMNFQQPGLQIPAYLTVPEPVDLGIPWYLRLGREIVRSMAKGMFHTGANWVDHNPFGRYKPPQ